MQTTQNKKFHNQSHREVRTQPSLFCYAIFYSSFIIPYIFRFENFPIKLKEGKILSMNRREYVLVEFPPSQTYSYIRQGIQQLQFAGYEVILAHVERYHCIAEDVELAEELYDMGVNLQVNADSITGGSGRKIRKFIEELMNRDLVFCVGTDAHDTKHRPPKMKKAAAHVEKRYGEDYTRRIFYSNAKSMLKKRD